MLRGRLARPKLTGAIIMRRLSGSLGLARHWVVGTTPAAYHRERPTHAAECRCSRWKTICRSCVEKGTQGHTTSIARHTDRVIVEATKRSPLTMAAWGTHRTLLDHRAAVAAI
jgi:hypothetical protein